MWGETQTKKEIRGKIGRTAVIYGLTTLFAYGLWGIHTRAENIILVYLISVIVLMIEVQGFLWGCAYTVLCILVFNFLFTEPRFTLRVNDFNYLVTMGIFMAVSAITGFLVSKLGEQVRLSRENEERMEALLEISSGYLTLSGLENIVYYGIKSLYQAAGERCVVYVAVSGGELGEPYYLKQHFSDPGILDNSTPACWCYINRTTCGAGTGFYTNSGWVYLPIRNRDACLGVIGIYTNGQEIDDRHKVFINTVISQMAMAIEKERTRQPDRPGNPKADGNVPQAAPGSLDEEFCQPFRCVVKEARRLIQTETEREKIPEILLKLHVLETRARNLSAAYLLEQGKEPADKKAEDFAAIAERAAGAYEGAGGNRIVWTKKPAEPVIVQVNAVLAEQVVSSLLDNALLYTPGEENVYVSLGQEQGYGILEISDRGNGISFMELQKKQKGAGEAAGLSVSGKIIEAYEGRLVIKSSQYGGTTVSVFLPVA